MGEHRQKKLRGGIVRTADEYRASGEEKPKKLSKREVERIVQERLMRMLFQNLKGW